MQRRSCSIIVLAPLFGAILAGLFGRVDRPRRRAHA